MKGLKLTVMIIMGAAALILFSACQPESPQPGLTRDPPDQLLFYGDGLTSSNLGLPAHLKLLAGSADPPLEIEVRAVTSGTVRLKDHLESARFGVIQEESWDVVVLQEDHHWATSEEFFEAVREFDAEIEAAGAETVLLMTWERDTVMKFLTLEEIADDHRYIARELDLKVAPAGLAWQRSMEKRPDLNLYDYDRHHPSARGTYLTACVLYAVIFEKSPVGLEYQPAEMIANVDSLAYLGEKWSMTDEEAAFLQRTAWDTVVEYRTLNK